MTLALENYLTKDENVLQELPSKNGSRQFPLRLPEFPEGRSFGDALLELPETFPESGFALIKLSPENALKVPHVESDGKVCFEVGDPGPSSGVSAEDRAEQLVWSFFENFLKPWCAGELDGDFLDEAQTYWLIYCNQHFSQKDVVRKIYTLSTRTVEPITYFASYLKDRRIVIADSLSSDRVTSNAFVLAMARGNTLARVLVAEIPIDSALSPISWPQDQVEMKRILRMRLGNDEAKKFLSINGRRGREIHRIVILRAPDCSFGYLLPGGPPYVEHTKFSSRAYPNTKLLPLVVDRLDPSWTCGRDQHPELLNRQKKHILVIGAGALGSPIIEQLAKAGIGAITIVDNDYLSAANVGRHVLGVDSIGRSKPEALIGELEKRWPSCKFLAEHKTAQTWLKTNNLSSVDMVLDLTGEPNVRLSIDLARKQNACALAIGWMEPYVAAAHTCLLPAGESWMLDSVDRLKSLQAVSWPEDVMQREPACSSTFQSYTSAAATHAVALVTEAVLDLADDNITSPIVRHWIRGQKFLDAHYNGLSFRDWAISAAPFDGVSFETKYE